MESFVNDIKLSYNEEGGMNRVLHAIDIFRFIRKLWLKRQAGYHEQCHSPPHLNPTAEFKRNATPK